MDTDHPRTDNSTSTELLIRIPKCTEEFTCTEDDASDRYLPIKERLTALRRKLNETAPIAQLPAEVLGAIFHSYVLDHWDLYLSQTKDSPTPTVTPYSWFPILHICHHWRQVALSNPALWTYVVPTNDQCVEFVLSRSGSLPLTAFSSNDEESGIVVSSTGIVRLSFPSLTEQVAYCNIIKRLPRIRTAKFRAHPMSGFSWTVSLFEKSKVAADMLEELCLEMGPDTKDVSVFRSRAMQGLRSLRIIGGTLAVTQSLLRSSLTTLDATLARVMLTASALDEFIVALSQLPLLQRMTLRSLNWMPRTALPNVLPPPQHIATFPQLKHISLEGPALGLAELIHCLVFPSDAVIRLHSAPGGSMEESQLALSSLLPKVIGSAVPNPGNSISSPRVRPRSLLLDHDTLGISLWRSVQSWPLNEDETRSSEEPDHHMFIPFDTNDELVVTEPMAALDLTEVITIHLRLGLSADAWTRIFEHLALPKLESIRIFNEVNAETFLVAMATRLTQPQPTVEANGDAASSYYFFPDLKRLELDTVMCHEGWRCGPSVRDFFRTVTTSLQLRAERVRKLEQLLLIRPINLLPSDYQALDSGYEVHNPIMDESEDETYTPGTDAEDGEDGASSQESDWDDPDLE